MSQVVKSKVPPKSALSWMSPSNWWQRLVVGARRLCVPRSDWSDFAGDDWPERIMQVNVTDDHHAKQGRSTCRWRLDAGPRQLVVYLKRHFELRRRHGLLAALWPSGDWSPAMQERRNLEWARAHGLPVPRVVAGGEFLGPWGKLQSFLAIEELTDMLPLHEAIPLAAQQLDPATFRLWKAGLTREIARLARFLHDHNRFHKDLYLCHFFIQRADTTRMPTWTDRVFMIDFHRLARHTIARRFWISKDIGQLLYSSDVTGIEARDRLRFWRAYMGPERRTLLGRLLRRVVLMRGRRYRDHNKKAAERSVVSG
jgi:hypothetical protein